MKSVEQFCRGNSEFSLNPGDFHCFRFRVGVSFRDELVHSCTDQWEALLGPFRLVLFHSKFESVKVSKIR